MGSKSRKFGIYRGEALRVWTRMDNIKNGSLDWDARKIKWAEAQNKRALRSRKGQFSVDNKGEIRNWQKQAKHVNDRKHQNPPTT